MTLLHIPTILLSSIHTCRGPHHLHPRSPLYPRVRPTFFWRYPSARCATSPSSWTITPIEPTGDAAATYTLLYSYYLLPAAACIYMHHLYPRSPPYTPTVSLAYSPSRKIPSISVAQSQIPPTLRLASFAIPMLIVPRPQLWTAFAPAGPVLLLSCSCYRCLVCPARALPLLSVSSYFRFTRATWPRISAALSPRTVSTPPMLDTAGTSYSQTASNRKLRFRCLAATTPCLAAAPGLNVCFLPAWKLMRISSPAFSRILLRQEPSTWSWLLFRPRISSFPRRWHVSGNYPCISIPTTLRSPLLNAI
ncbi:hypothetical protein B0H16DRAFT_1889719, partial [Mycena metata]